MRQLLIFPFSGTAVEALDCLGDQWKCIGFISDDPTVIGKTFFNVKVYDRKALELYPAAKVLAVHGSPASYLKRAEILNSLSVGLERFATVIHPNAIVSDFASVGINVLIMAGVVITANANVGNHVIILPNSVVHHDSKIGDYTLIAANVTIAGNVTIEDNCYLGAASSVKNGIVICEKTLVGMGANVVYCYPAKSKLIGNPAKPLKNE